LFSKLHDLLIGGKNNSNLALFQSCGFDGLADQAKTFCRWS